MVHDTNHRPGSGSSKANLLRLVPDETTGVGVRSLARGLQILVALNGANPATVARLTEITGLPKPTVIRQLKTLCAEGYVDRDPDGEGYRVTHKVRLLSRGYDHEDALVHAAKPVLYDLARNIPWPGELLQCDGEAMQIQAHNRNHVPLSIRGLEVRRLPLIGSSSGEAYLAWCAPRERRAILDRLAGKAAPASDAPSLAAFERHLSSVRKRGYGLREWTILTQSLTVISVPVLVNDEAVAALSLVCLSNAVSAADRDARFLPALREAAAAIAAAAVEARSALP